MGGARIYTPKDFKITGIMGDVVGIVEKAWLVKGLVAGQLEDG